MTNLIIHQCFRYLLSTQFNLLLANIAVLLCFFFLFLVVFNNFFTSPVDNKNVRLRHALAIPTGVPITVANDVIEKINNIINLYYSFVADKTIKDLSK